MNFFQSVHCCQVNHRCTYHVNPRIYEDFLLCQLHCRLAKVKAKIVRLPSDIIALYLIFPHLVAAAVRQMSVYIYLIAARI